MISSSTKSKIESIFGHFFAKDHTSIASSPLSKSWIPRAKTSSPNLLNKSKLSIWPVCAFAKDHKIIFIPWSVWSSTGRSWISRSINSKRMSQYMSFSVNDHKNCASCLLLKLFTSLCKISSLNFSKSSWLPFPVFMKDHKAPDSPRFSKSFKLSLPSRILCSTWVKNRDLFIPRDAKPLRSWQTAGAMKEFTSRFMISCSHSVTNHTTFSLNLPKAHTMLARSLGLHFPKSAAMFVSKSRKTWCCSCNIFLVDVKFFFGELTANLAKRCKIVILFTWVIPGEFLKCSYR